MDIVLYTTIFVLGTIIGSFLNVIINRYGKESIQGRSHCESCAHTLSPLELIPLLSFFFLRGRCVQCNAPVSFQYSFVELLTGDLFLLSFLKFGFSVEFVFSIIVWSLLIIIAVYDFKHTIIPDEIVFSFIFIAFIRIIFLYGIKGLFTGDGFLYVLSGILFFLPFFLLWWYSKGEWIGLGDGKLALGIGFFLGLQGGLSAIILSFWIGAIVSLVLLFFSRFLKGKNLLFKDREITGSGHEYDRTGEPASGARSYPARTSSFESDDSQSQNDLIRPEGSDDDLLLGAKVLTMKSEIPFGPFLIFGTALVFFFGVSVIDFSIFVS
ncbi:MAG: prepilin peptidase [Patescibacteria group bacterium]